jgi:hypothetical protein
MRAVTAGTTTIITMAITITTATVDTAIMGIMDLVGASAFEPISRRHGTTRRRMSIRSREPSSFRRRFTSCRVTGID